MLVKLTLSRHAACLSRSRSQSSIGGPTGPMKPGEGRQNASSSAAVGGGLVFGEISADRRMAEPDALLVQYQASGPFSSGSRGLSTARTQISLAARADQAERGEPKPQHHPSRRLRNRSRFHALVEAGNRTVSAKGQDRLFRHAEGRVGVERRDPASAKRIRIGDRMARDALEQRPWRAWGALGRRACRRRTSASNRERRCLS